jgi:hypothetical protein
MKHAYHFFEEKDLKPGDSIVFAVRHGKAGAAIKITKSLMGETEIEEIVARTEDQEIHLSRYPFKDEPFMDDYTDPNLYNGFFGE